VDRFRLSDTTTLFIDEGDLTEFEVDAIVNAANEALLGGGGVDGAIHQAAGPELLEACRALPEVSPGVRCPTGEARITPGFNLPARHVIHTVGPMYRSASVSAPFLRAAYRSSLELANQHHVRTIALPAISCGVYGYPPAAAAKIAVEAAHAHAGSLEQIRFVLSGVAMRRTWLSAAEQAR
jgi:O-acetyl-ADP-ribose deacetylase (regulator of RNase III)